MKNQVVICAIAKNEGRYLLEWIAYHKVIGFDHIYLYDNDSDDHTADILYKSGIKDFVTRISWPRAEHKLPQPSAYAHWLKTYREETEWVAVLDLDEFVNLHQHDSIKDFLSHYPSAAAVGINWRVFGDSGKKTYQPGLLMERFTQASTRNFGPNHLVKTIARARDVSLLHIHTHQLKESTTFISTSGIPLNHFPSARQNIVEHDIAQINHYFTKSAEEWIIKRSRGKADLPTDHASHIRNDHEFAFHNRNEEEDRSLLRFQGATLRLIEEWSTNKALEH